MSQPLGEFEQVVLLAALRVNGEVYGVPIVEEIERRTGRSVSAAAVYVTLRRLEEKSLVSSSLSEPVAERGGKPRRCWKVKPAGVKLLRESRRMMDSLWSGLDAVIGESK